MGIRETKREFMIQQWTKIIQERIVSGLTIKEYCQQKHITIDTYKYWLKIIRKASIEEVQKQVPMVQGARFAEVVPPVQEKLPSAQGIASYITIEVNGIIIGINNGASKDLLKMVLEVARDA